MSYKARAGASKEAKDLFFELSMLMFHGVMFGQQDAPLTGCENASTAWAAPTGSHLPDVARVCGKSPAVYGFDFGWLTEPELYALSSPPLFSDVTEAFDSHKILTEDHWSNGGIATFSWHVANSFTRNLADLVAGNPPYNGMSAGERIGVSFTHNGETIFNSAGAAGRVTALDASGNLHPDLVAKLGVIADFATSLRVDGKPVPILFRPYHENNINYFWWDQNQNRPDDYKTLWVKTVEFLDAAGADNILYVYSPNVQKTTARFQADFDATYPGKDSVDILAIDFYPEKKGNNPAKGRDYQAQDLIEQIDFVYDRAFQEGKLMAVSECGLEKLMRVEATGSAKVAVNDYWTDDYLLPYWREKNVLISYSLIWKNVDPMGEFYGVYPGHSSEPDFLTMASSTKKFVGSLSKFRREVLFRSDAQRKRGALRAWWASGGGNP